VAEYISTGHSAIQGKSGSSDREIAVKIGEVWLQGNLSVPKIVKGMVLFAHGGGSSRLSPRNQFVAYELNEAGFATCLFDLLSLEEEQEDQAHQRFRFDVAMLSGRLLEVTDWVMQTLSEGLNTTEALPIGYFGASSGAAAALVAAAKRPDLVRAVVSRGGRPDLASHALGQVQAATLLLVGELDEVVLELNRTAYEQLPEATPKELVVIPEAGHLFEEPGKLENVAQYASQWFERWLAT
jgi:putative phosphoribosyl transferase